MPDIIINNFGIKSIYHISKFRTFIILKGMFAKKLWECLLNKCTEWEVYKGAPRPPPRRQEQGVMNSLLPDREE